MICWIESEDEKTNVETSFKILLLACLWSFCEGCIPPEICKARRYRQCHIEWSQSWENETTWGCYTASRLDVGGSQCVSMCEYCTECLCLLATSTPWKLVLHGSSPCQFAIPLMLVCKSLVRYVVCIPLPCHKRKHGKCISLQCSMGSTQWVSLEVNCVDVISLSLPWEITYQRKYASRTNKMLQLTQTGTCNCAPLIHHVWFHWS